jgi:hypothetical protein
MATKKGKCTNIDGCDKAYNNEIQEVDSMNFVCEECGKPLEELKGKIVEPPFKRIGIICGFIIILFLLIWGVVKMLSGSNPPDENVPYSDTIDTSLEDTINISKPIDSDRIHDTIVKETIVHDTVVKKEDKIIVSPSTTRQNNGELNLGYSIYNGPISNGKAHGSGGTLRFTRSYTIDLKQLSGEKVEVNSGDRMVDVTMNNNRLISGLLKMQNGDTRWINIGE